MKRKSSLPQTPTAPVPVGPEVSLPYFVSIIRSIKLLGLYAAQDPVEPLVSMWKDRLRPPPPIMSKGALTIPGFTFTNVVAVLYVWTWHLF